MEPSTTTVVGAAVASSARTTVTTNLFEVPTGACGLALVVAGLGTSNGGLLPEANGTAVTAQAISNPDIAGIGILIAFLATAYGIFIWMFVAYVCRWLSPSLLGHVDEFIFRRPARKWTSPPWWQDAVHQSIIAYADLQIATGVGILVAAFSTISTMSVYHFQVAIYLAWMASNTHLTAISLLQTEFRENRNKSIARRLRLGGMLFLGVMLVVALVPTTSHNWLAILTNRVGNGRTYGSFHRTAMSAAGIPARCFWQRKYSGGLTPDAAWSFLILILSFLWKGLLLFRSSQRYLKVSFRQKMQGPLQKRLDRLSALLEETREHRTWPILQYKMALSSYLAIWALFELSQSFVMSIWICGAGLVWGSLQILVPRQSLPSQTLNTENSWTFGQILPVLLLAVPILSFAEGYTYQKQESSRKSSMEKRPVTDDQNVQTADVGSISSYTTSRHPTAQHATNTSLDIQRNPFTAPRADESHNRINARRRNLNSNSPWRCDKRVYESRFVRFAFWGSQLGILSLGALFVVFYFELFVPLTAPGQKTLRTTLQTDYGIWFIAGCTVIGWVGVAVFLLIGGATFSSLFKVPGSALQRRLS